MEKLGPRISWGMHPATPTARNITGSMEMWTLKSKPNLLHLNGLLTRSKAICVCSAASSSQLSSVRLKPVSAVAA